MDEHSRWKSDVVIHLGQPREREKNRPFVSDLGNGNKIRSNVIFPFKFSVHFECNTVYNIHIVKTFVKLTLKEFLLWIVAPKIDIIWVQCCAKYPINKDHGQAILISMFFLQYKPISISSALSPHNDINFPEILSAHRTLLIWYGRARKSSWLISGLVLNFFFHFEFYVFLTCRSDIKFTRMLACARVCVCLLLPKYTMTHFLCSIFPPKSR